VALDGDDGVGEVAEADGGAGFSFGVAKQRLGVDGAEAADAYLLQPTCMPSESFHLPLCLDPFLTHRLAGVMPHCRYAGEEKEDKKDAGSD
jgi:hypothetical protein